MLAGEATPHSAGDTVPAWDCFGTLRESIGLAMTKNNHMLELTAQNFQHEVLESDKPTLVYFYSPVGCAPCKMLTPVVEKLHEELNGTVKVGKLNIYPNMPITLKYDVMTAPVLMLFKAGQPVVRLQGFHPHEKILAVLAQHPHVGG